MNFITQYKGLRKEVYILFIGKIVTSLGGMAWPVLTLLLNQKLGMDAAHVSYFIVSSAVLLIPGGVLGGKLADSCNKRNVIILFDLLSIAVFILAAFLPTSIISAILLIVASFAQNVEGAPYSALIADITAIKDREKAFSLTFLGGNIGTVIAPTLAGILFKNYLWLIFLVSGLSIAVSTVLIFFFVRNITPVEEENEEEAQYQQTADGESILSVLRNNKPVLLFLCSLCVYNTVYAMFNYLVPLDIGAMHGDAGALIYGSINSITCFAIVAGTPLLTKLLEKRSMPEKNLFGQIMFFAAYAIFLCLMKSVVMCYVSAIVLTIGQILTTISDRPYYTARIPSSHWGRIEGTLTVVGGIFQCIILLTAGAMYDSLGSTATWTAILVLSLAGILIGSFNLSYDRKRYPALYK